MNIGVEVKKVYGFGKTPSLDNNGQNCTFHSEWSRPQRRCYQRIKSGLARHRGERLRFLTLTTPKKPKRELSEAFAILKLRIKRVKIKRLLEGGYLGRGEVRKYYGGRWKAGIDFEYLKVETNEGANGVYHVLYFGDYLPQAWLSEQWEDIIGARIVDIRATRGRVNESKRLGRYCVAQYCGGQSEFMRYSWSWGWVFKGFVGVWKGIIEYFGLKKGIKIWEMLLSGVRRKFEYGGRGYRVGMDPPYVALYDWVLGRWMPAWIFDYRIFSPHSRQKIYYLGNIFLKEKGGKE